MSLIHGPDAATPPFDVEATPDTKQPQKILHPPPLVPYVRVGEDGRWIFNVDNHLLSTFTQCEALFYYRHIMHYRKKSGGGAMNIGIWWAAVLEDFYIHMGLNQRQMLSNPPAREGMLSYAIKNWINLDMHTLSKRDPKRYEAFANSVSKDDLKRALPSSVHKILDEILGTTNVPLGALLMAGRYYDTYAETDFRNWKVIAAEQGFGLRNEVFVGESDRVVVNLTGRPDLVVLNVGDDTLLPVDHKTVDRIKSDASRKFKPHPQTVGYIYAVGALAKSLNYDRVVDRCIINLGARLEPSEKPRDGNIRPRFTRVYPAYSAAEIEEWRQGVILKCERLRNSFETDKWMWNESACHLYGGCDFRGVHALASNARHVAIDADFVQVDPWKPYEVEEDEDE